MGLALVLGCAGTAVAVPPPPPNPSDSEIDAGRTEARKRAGQVGSLTNKLAQAEDRLARLRDEVALKLELANKALVDMQAAQDAASEAKRVAEAARRESIAAGEDIDTARKRVDRFVAGSFQQGSTVGSMSAYIGSDSPEDLLARAQLLEAVGGSELNALEDVRRARVEKSNADAAARKAVDVAEEKQRASERAKRAADVAHATAVEARSSQASQTAALEADRDQVQKQLYAAQSTVRGLEGQRERYEDWQAAKRREEARRAREAALAAANNSGGGGNDRPASGSSQATVETVIARAMSQLGTPYAWGGGNTSGPTYGIRDGGVADSYGDYLKIGFDCSGLMIYAFAPVASLPHYSGYQYHAGRKVPLSKMRRGDMLFWGNGRIHHVALYLGNGQMIEAPQSGLRVRIAPVRWGDILPYATRLIG
ncbi:MAG: NlpC/P60 family protein [Pseudonocardiaceae bacterium]